MITDNLMNLLRENLCNGENMKDVPFQTFAEQVAENVLLFYTA